MEKTRKTLIANLMAGLLLSAAVFALGLSRDNPVIRCLCDGFFVASVLLLGVGGIKYVRNKGAFDVAAYGIKTAFHTTYPWARRESPLENREEEFMEYRERKEKARKSAKPELLSGLVYFLLSLIMLVIYSVSK